MSVIADYIQSLRPQNVRLLPVLMGSAALLFALKCGNIIVDLNALVTPAQAASAQELAQIAPAAGGAEKPAVTTPAKPAEAAPAKADADDSVPDASTMSRSEIGLLQELSARRNELKQREAQLDMREHVLEATEKRVDDKIAVLKASEAEIQRLVGVHDQQEEARLKSLVKVYETMKPQDAARILEKLDPKILLDVVQRMSERKMAPVLAAMTPDSAKIVTTALATHKPLPGITTGS